MNEIIEAFDKFLHQKSLSFKAVVIGGAALTIMGIITRKTRDIDCLDPDIPNEIKKASLEFASVYKKFQLSEDWLNNGPIELKRNLPVHWELRLVNLYKGKSLDLQTLGRPDLLKTKLFACVDRDFDFEDCINLKPTREELEEAIPWVSLQDANALWPDHVKLVFDKIKKALGYE